MSPLDLQKDLQALTERMAARWVACGEQRKSLPRFSAAREAMREKQQEIDHLWFELIRVYLLAGEEFCLQESQRFNQLTNRPRGLIGHEPKGQG